MPRVTILLPTYEPRKEYLHEAVKSLLAQTMPDWELFVHDDASRTDVRSMFQPFLHDNRMTFVKSAHRHGIGGNWNACLPLGTAPFLQFLFQDDTWEPQYLATALEPIEHDPSIGLVGVNHRYITDKMNTVALSPIYREVGDARAALAPGKHTGREFLLEWADKGLRPNIIGEPSFVLLRRSAVTQTGTFNERMVQNLDSEYWMRLLLAHNLYFIADELGNFRVHEAAASSRNSAQGRGLTDRLVCFEELMTWVPQGPERQRVRRALVYALADMIRKYRRRRQGGGGIGDMRKSDIIRFAMRHPVVMAKAMVKSLR